MPGSSLWTNRPLPLQKPVKFLFDIILDLKSERKAIAYISHKLDELFRIADDYIVLRDGKFIDSGQMNHITKRELISKMVGRGKL